MCISERSEIKDKLSLVTEIWAGRQGFDSRHGQGFFFLFATASRPTLEPAKLRIQFVSGDLSSELKRPGREADRLTPSSADVKDKCSSWRGAQDTSPWLGT
jgi:hypothetical protein